ncbi:MAG TPA: hypothetical protein VFR23_25845 [Jiangellaceae bacterium]|nr:hypothetical protein [Jiangellaceae bacterium]
MKLTPDGVALLQRARDLLAVHDAMLDEVRGLRSPVVVDVVADGLTPLVLVRAARDDGGADLVTRTSGWLAAALPLLLAGDIDVAFGHIEPARLPPVLKQRVVIDEPLGILVPQDHHRRDSRSRARAAHRFQSRPIAGECSGADPCDIQMLAVLHNAIDRAHTAWDGPDATI